MRIAYSSLTVGTTLHKVHPRLAAHDFQLAIYPQVYLSLDFLADRKDAVYST